MGRAERVVFALAALGEAAEAAGLAQGADAVATTGQDLVRIALMANIPDQPVIRRVEHMMDRHRQLNHTQRRTQMPPGLRDRLNRLLT